MAPKPKKSAGLLRAQSVFASAVTTVILFALLALMLSLLLKGDASVDGKVSDVVFAGTEQVAKWVIFFGALVLGLQWLVKVSLHSKTVPASAEPGDKNPENDESGI